MPVGSVMVSCRTAGLASVAAVEIVTSPDVNVVDRDGVARYHGRRECVSDVIRAVAGLFCHQQSVPVVSGA
ncbi:hypothetical protein GCM10010340_34990 [Streptomyces griseoloalbus]|nr:hypothetical protein GCM10010340_34990 [Streptomyces albaduncus]